MAKNESVIKYSGIYGGITYESKPWDDFEVIGEKQMLNLKITKIKIYSGKFNDKDAIFGVGFTYRSTLNGEEKVVEHRGSDDFIDFKELVIKKDEFLTDFHIRFSSNAEYISQLGFATNKNNSLLVGTEEGEDKIIGLNGGDNIIVGTFGRLNKKLDATGVLLISKKDYYKRLFIGILYLRNLIKKDKKFKEEWDKKQEELPLEFKYMWRVVNLPETLLPQILKFY